MVSNIHEEESMLEGIYTHKGMRADEGKAAHDYTVTMSTAHAVQHEKFLHLL
jgi:hypothetical protein